MTSGFSVVDFMNLPPVERRIMRMVLRDAPVTYPQLRAAFATLPADQRPDEGKLNATLAQLTRDHWLVCQGSGQQTAYRMNGMRRTGTQNTSFWEKLELETIDQPYSLQFCPPTERPSRAITSGGKRRLPSQLWDCLMDDEA